MSNVIPVSAKVSPDSSIFRTAADFDLVNMLLKKYSLYNVPPDLRNSIVEQANDTIKDANASIANKNAAMKMVLEMDKRNLDVVKIAMPQRHEHFNAREATDEELEALLIEAHDKIVKRQLC